MSGEPPAPPMPPALPMPTPEFSPAVALPTWRSQLPDYLEREWSPTAKPTAQLNGVPRGPGVFALVTAEGAVAQFGGTDRLAARLLYYLSPPTGSKAPSRQRADMRGLIRRILYRATGGGFETKWECLRLTRLIDPVRYRDVLKLSRAVFVWANLSENSGFPRLCRTDDLQGLPPRAAVVGPLNSRAAATRYLELLVDGFELCQCRQSRAHVEHLACPTWQMGKCPLPADAAEHANEYRRRVSDALRPSHGGHDRRRSELESAMYAAAERLAFDEAARYKARLSKLVEAGAGEYAVLTGLCDCDWLLVVATAAPADWVGYAMRAGHFGRVVHFRQAEAEAKLTELLSWLVGPDSLAAAVAAPAEQREDHLALLVGWRAWRERAATGPRWPTPRGRHESTTAAPGSAEASTTDTHGSHIPAQMGLMEPIRLASLGDPELRAAAVTRWATALKKIYSKSKKFSV